MLLMYWFHDVILISIFCLIFPSELHWVVFLEYFFVVSFLVYFLSGVLSLDFLGGFFSTVF